ncbi:MAG: hypothetical protein ACKVT1_16745 [Dehalococcoidia bacterium]
MIPSISPYDVRAEVSRRGSVYPGDAEPASLVRRSEHKRVLLAARKAERAAGARHPRLVGRLRLVLRLGQ